jgi:hypothetical protein
MPFLTPLALLGLLFLPVVLAMYLLKLRRDPAVVSSTLLWQRLVADVEANAPWQKLRRSLLLLLQLLLVLILALLAARPFLERPARLAGDIVLVVDTSASMGATDVVPNRLAAAKEAALAALRDLPAGGRVSVIAAGSTARMVANETQDMSRIRQAIASIELSTGTGNLGDALALASALAARSGDAEVLVATDASIAQAPDVRVDAPVRVLQIGSGRKNQAIVALAVRTAPSGVTRSVFISVANVDEEIVTRRIELYANGSDTPFEVREQQLEAARRTDVVIDEIPQQIGDERVSSIEVRLAAADDAATGDPDQLAVDDRAWAVIPPDRLRTILLVSRGDPYLETALSYLPNAELYGVTPNDYGPQTKPELFDLIIFEDFIPAEPPPTAVLMIAPPRTSPFGQITGDLREPGIGSLDPSEPVLRYVDLSTTHISTAKKLTLPDWARTIIPGPQDSPLLYAGERAGQPTAVLAFEPRRSDLPLQVAFPILLANLTGELLGGSGSPVDAIAPGSPVNLAIPADATGVRVSRPDGTTLDLVPSAIGGSSATFTQTDQLGVYTVTPILAASPTGSPSATPAQTPTASPPASGSPGASPSGRPPSPPTDPDEPIRFAVDLFDVDESNIVPGDASRITRLGSTISAGPGASPQASPGATAAPGPTTPPERRPARDELWVPIVLLVLIVLMVEYAVYQRDSLIRIWRAATGRAGRLSAFRRGSGTG